jgi:hypothetical protein
MYLDAEEDDGIGGMGLPYSDVPRVAREQFARRMRDLEDEYEDDCAARNRRRARMKQLETQVQVLTARVQSRDIIIAQQRAKIERLQALLAAPAMKE